MKQIEKSSLVKGPPIFIVGYMHSGTTLLFNLVGNHTSVVSSGGETKFFEFLPIIRRNYPDLNDDQEFIEYLNYLSRIIRFGYYLKGDKRYRYANIGNDIIEEAKKRSNDGRGYESSFFLVFTLLAESHGKSRWLEKTPTHIFHVDEIKKWAPSALFIEIVRDPRDILASKKTRKLTVWGSNRYSVEEKPWKHLEKSFDPFWDSLSWKSAIDAGIVAKGKYPETWLTIRYEDLVIEPEKQAREICDFLSLPYESKMIEVASRNSAEWGQKKEKGISNESVGRWKRVLSPEETAICQTLLKKDIGRFGYSLADIPRRVALKSLMLLPLSLFEFFDRLSKRYQMGGMAFVSNIFSNYFRRFIKIIAKSGRNGLRR
jgi:hypothetical protein